MPVTLNSATNILYFTLLKVAKFVGFLGTELIKIQPIDSNVPIFENRKINENHSTPLSRISPPSPPPLSNIEMTELPIHSHTLTWNSVIILPAGTLCLSSPCSSHLLSYTASLIIPPFYPSHRNYPCPFLLPITKKLSLAFSSFYLSYIISFYGISSSHIQIIIPVLLFFPYPNNYPCSSFLSIS